MYVYTIAITTIVRYKHNTQETQKGKISIYVQGILDVKCNGNAYFRKKISSIARLY